MNRNRAASGAGLAIACVLAALGGYLLAGRARTADAPAGAGKAGSSFSEASAKASRGPEEGRQAVGKGKAGERSPEEIKKLAASLLERYGHSPEPREDWELHDSTTQLLAGLSEDELSQLAEAVHGPPAEGSEGFRAVREDVSALLRDITMVWADKDPAAAISSRAGMLSMAWGDAFQLWAGRDRGEAEAWLLSGEMPEGFKKITGYLQRDYLGKLATTDFDGALAFCQKGDADLRAGIFSQWGPVLADAPEKSAKLIRAIQAGDPAQALASYKSVLSGLAAVSPEKAADLAETLELPDEQQAELTDSWIGGWAKKSPAEALGYWAELGEEKVPAAVATGLQSWSIHSPKEMAEWLGKLPDGATKESLKLSAVPTLVRFEHFQQATDVALSIRDQDQRLQQLRLLGRTLEEKEAGAMEKLAESLPEEDRAKLKP